MSLDITNKETTKAILFFMSISSSIIIRKVLFTHRPMKEMCEIINLQVPVAFTGQLIISIRKKYFKRSISK